MATIGAVPMGARQQGRVTTKRTKRAIDELTLVLGSVEMDTLTHLRALDQPLGRLTACVRLFNPADQPQIGSELAPLRSIGRQLEPLQQLVCHPDVIAPPFSPDMRQRVGYATAQLVAMRNRLADSKARIPGKAVRRDADRLMEALVKGWTDFRSDPSLENLTGFERSICMLGSFYFALGLSKSEPRVRGMRRLCLLLAQASDRNGDLDDVPALLREVTSAANELTRPTLTEHRQWLKSLVD